MIETAALTSADFNQRRLCMEAQLAPGWGLVLKAAETGGSCSMARRMVAYTVTTLGVDQMPCALHGPHAVLLASCYTGVVACCQIFRAWASIEPPVSVFEHARVHHSGTGMLP